MHTPRLLVLVLSLLTAGIHGQLQQPAPGPVVPPINGGHILAGVTQQPGLPNSKAAGAPSGGTVTDPTIHVIDIKMPGVRPHQEDQYMCTSAQMPADPQYIINFEALASVDRAHHLLVYGCDQPASISPWDCRSICQRQGPKILYAWARNAPPTRMPPDVGFQVGVKGARSLVLQIHYKKAVPQSEPGDTSGVRLTLSKQRQKYIAGIFLLLRYSLHMPPRTPVIHGDVSCKYNGATSLYPFGYRVHAHSLSPVISAYQNNGSWSLLGKGNPQWPQAFYPINEQHEIKPGDLLFARCTYDTTNKATPTNIGGNHDDEMCNFYMMYYTEAEQGQSYLMCNSNDYPNLFANLPAGNDVPPPPNPALEEEATHAHPHHAHALSGNAGDVSGLAAEVPATYGHIGDFLNGELTSGGRGQLNDPRIPTNPRSSSYLRLFDRDDIPSRFDYYSDYLGDDDKVEKATDPDYFYYEVQHQRSRNRNKNPSTRREGDLGGLGAYVGAEEEERDRYRGDNIHGMDGAHAFFGFPDPKGDDYEGRSRLGQDDTAQRTNYGRDKQGSVQGGLRGSLDRDRVGMGESRYGLSNDNDGQTRYDPDAVQSPNRQGVPQNGSRMRNRFGMGRIGGGGGGLGGGGGSRSRTNPSPTNPPPRTPSPTHRPDLLTPAPVLANKEVSGSSPKHDEVNNVVNKEVTANNKLLNVTPSLSPGKDAVTANQALNGPAVEETKGWPALAAEDGITLGQVAGVAVDKLGNIHVFHRASRVWERSSFDMMNRFNPALGPIKENTIIVFNPQGKVLRQWGANLFYMPHGLHLDDQDNVWVTDVGLHQVFKFNKDSATPSLSLGNKLRPGSGDGQFCKPTDVGTLTTGEFYVTDGYCNSRVLKYSADGKLLKQWGTSTKVVGADHLPPPGSFDIPHSVTVLEKRGWVCVADRENGRIQCFTTAGDFIKQFHHKEFAGRLFAVSYSAVTDTLYAVNGPDLYNNQVAVRGFSIHLDTGNLMETWGPKEGFKNPHDLAVSPQGDFIYVAELDPHKVWRMYVHTEVLEAQKAKKAGPLSHPSSVDGGVDNTEVKETEQGDLGASLVIGALLVVPVIFIVAVTVFMRLRKNGRFAFITTMMYRKNRNRRFNLGTLLSRTKGFNRINPDDASDHELDHLNSDSDVEEYSATTRKA